MRREPRSCWRRGAGRHRGSPSWLHAQPRSVTEGVGNRDAMSDSRVLERAMGRLPRHPIGAVCPASHARDREHSIHRFVERVSAELNQTVMSSVAPVDEPAAGLTSGPVDR
jgi:hypothetical protein